MTPERLGEIRIDNPDHLGGWSILAKTVFRIYFCIVRW